MRRYRRRYPDLFICGTEGVLFFAIQPTPALSSNESAHQPSGGRPLVSRPGDASQNAGSIRNSLHRLDEAANIVAENLAEDFVGHRHIRLAPHMITKLRLDHAEGAFDLGLFVVVPQELLAVKAK